MSTAKGGMMLPVASGRATARVAWEQLRPQTLGLIASMLLLAVSSTTALLVPWGLGSLVDVVTGDRSTLTGVVLALGVGVIGSAVAGAAGVMLLTAGLERALAGVRERFVAAALALPPALVDELPDGELVSRTTDDVETVGQVTTGAVPAFVGAVFAIVATAVGLTALHPLFLLALLTVVPVHLLALRAYLGKAPRLYAAESAAVAARASEMLTASRALPTLHAYGWGPIAERRIRWRSWNVLRWALRTRVVLNRFGFQLNMAEAVGLTAVLSVGGHLVFTDAATLGEVTAALLFFLALFGPFGALLMLVDSLQAAGASLARIAGVVRLESGSEPMPRRDPWPDVGTGEPVTTVRGLVAGYPGRPDTLHGIDLDVGKGQWVAVVGVSGAGKSTLARCLVGALEPRAGWIRVCSDDPAELDERDRADRVVLISQEVHLFSGTLRDNLSIAREDASDEEILAAMTALSDGEFEIGAIDLDMRLGDGQSPVSELFAHRVALARALLSNAPLVLLDEATADTDTADSRRLHAASRRGLAGRTVITIAHQLNQVRGADRIIVLDKGRAVQSGTHEELMGRPGTYARLWEAWSSPRAGEAHLGRPPSADTDGTPPYESR